MKRYKPAKALSIMAHILALFVLLPVAACAPAKESAVVLTVNGSGVTAEEILMFLQEEKATTVSYFNRQYGAEYTADFWHTEYGGQTPLTYAKTAALEKLVLYKVQLEELAASGIVEDISFLGVKRAIEEANGQDYGLQAGAQNLSLNQLIFYWHEKNLITLGNMYKEQHTDEKFDLPYSTLYEEVKDEYFALGTQYTYTVIKASAENESALQIASELFEGFAAGNMPIVQVQEAAAQNHILLETESYTAIDLDRTTQNEEFGVYLPYLELLEPEKAAVVEQGGEVVLLWLTDKAFLGYLPQEEATETLYVLYCENTLEALFIQQAAAAKVIFTDAYEAIEMP